MTRRSPCHLAVTSMPKLYDPAGDRTPDLRIKSTLPGDAPLGTLSQGRAHSSTDLPLLRSSSVHSSAHTRSPGRHFRALLTAPCWHCREPFTTTRLDVVLCGDRCARSAYLAWAAS